MARLNKKRKNTKNKIIATILVVETLITAFAIGSMIGYNIELNSIQKIIISSNEIPSYLKKKLTNYNLSYFGGNNND